MTLSGWLVGVAILAAVNPVRLWPALPRGDRAASERSLVAGGGAALATTVVVALTGAAGWIVDGLAVSPPTMVVAAGLVLTVSGVWALVVGPPAAEPALAGRRAALVPVAVPFVLRPDVGLVAVAAGSADAQWAVVGAMVVAAGLVTVGAAVDLGGSSPRERFVRWSGRAVAAAAVAAGVALAVEGVFAV